MILAFENKTLVHSVINPFSGWVSGSTYFRNETKIGITNRPFHKENMKMQR